MDIGTYLSNVHLLRPTRIGSFLRSFRLHSPRYARETIAEICSMGVALATTPIAEIGSGRSCRESRADHRKQAFRLNAIAAVHRGTPPCSQAHLPLKAPRHPTRL
jgi:hypothetical protein